MVPLKEAALSPDMYRPFKLSDAYALALRDTILAVWSAAAPCPQLRTALSFEVSRLKSVSIRVMFDNSARIGIPLRPDVAGPYMYSDAVSCGTLNVLFILDRNMLSSSPHSPRFLKDTPVLMKNSVTGLKGVNPLPRNQFLRQNGQF